MTTRTLMRRLERVEKAAQALRAHRQEPTRLPPPNVDE